MLKEIRSGAPASIVFRRLLDSDPLMDTTKLGRIVFSEFPKLSPAANICLRRWMNAECQDDYPGEQLDAMIKAYMEEAGYADS